ncbi:MAG: hypothetical protein JOS17DRAFT_740812 [Linnemannia elongata]|nr:MAG: hypothetical protein JOS17DRAFT_740812 [Linnemannia elongata]
MPWLKIFFFLPFLSFLRSQTNGETRKCHVNTHSQAQQCSQQLFTPLNVIFLVFTNEEKNVVNFRAFPCEPGQTSFPPFLLLFLHLPSTSCLSTLGKYSYDDRVTGT